MSTQQTEISEKRIDRLGASLAEKRDAGQLRVNMSIAEAEELVAGYWDRIQDRHRKANGIPDYATAIQLDKLARLSPGSSITLASGETYFVYDETGHGTWVAGPAFGCPVTTAMHVLEAFVKAGAVVRLAEEREGGR